VEFNEPLGIFQRNRRPQTPGLQVPAAAVTMQIINSFVNNIGRLIFKSGRIMLPIGHSVAE
jgi:hypothetical protein